MSAWAHVDLGTVATIARTSIAPADVDPSTPYIGLDNIERGGAITGVESVGDSNLSSNKFRFYATQVLFGKLRPYLAKVSRPTFDGVCSTDILPITPGPKLDRGFLAHFLLLEDTVNRATARSSGANLPRLAPSELAKFQIPFPPLVEQRRIAQVLDQVNALRAKRRAAIARLDELAQSLFLDMFGEHSQNTKWPLVNFSELIESPLRNGVSPASNGKLQRNVLTLAALTGNGFNLNATKTGLFFDFPSSKYATSGDFLICRGNGNRELVGKGAFAHHVEPNTVFPDTMICARPSPSKITDRYLEFTWRSPRTRSQIISAARTTNGTYKVNQSALSSIKIPLPPLALQRSFDEMVDATRRSAATHQTHLAKLDELFASLQYRAFRGELFNSPN